MPFDFTPQQAPAETKPQHDTFSLEGLAAWLRTQPGEREYDWEDGADCLGCRYVGMYQYSRLSRALHLVEAIHVLYRKPWTYAAALERCEALLRERAL